MSRLVASGAMLAFVAMAVPALAAGHISLKQIVVGGNQNFQAVSINDHGRIAGTLYAAITDLASGIVLDGNVATVLPTPYAGGGAPHPTEINDSGDVVGWADAELGLPTLFLLRHGQVVPSYSTLLELPNKYSAFLAVNPIGLAGRDRVFFTKLLGLVEPSEAEYGVPPHLAAVPRLNRFTTIRGLSTSGMVSGTAFDLTGPKSVFLGSGKTFSMLAPPGAKSTMGGLMNPAGEVAGSYVDTAGAAHGFVYTLGAYTSFDMPEAAAAIDVTSINAAGRVAGSYQSAATGQQHAFLYNGTVVTDFGSYDSSLSLAVALNNTNTMVISAQYFDGLPKYVSYIAKCSGDIC